MPTARTTPDWRPALVAALIATCGVLAVLFTLRNTPAAHAQGQIRLEIDKQLQGSDLIKVGQEMTFTIRIRNTGTLTVTKLPLIDNYNASILQLRRTDPAYSTHDPASGEINWDDLTTNSLFGPLAPGQEITVVTVFRAIKAAPETVNFAKIGAAEGASGASGGGEEDSDKGAAEGGKVIVTKGLPPGQMPRVGEPITFTIKVRNDGAADLVQVPLKDIFDPAYLAFISAEPAPSSVSPNQLTWDDILPLLGRTRLRPNEEVTVTTVFTALKAFDGAGINRANADGTRDEFQNDVASPRQADIPVRIVGEATAVATATPTAATETAAPTATRTPRRNNPTATPDITATPTISATPELIATPITTATAVLTVTETPIIVATPISTTEVISGTAGSQPVQLPSTGEEAPIWPWAALVGVSLLIVGFVISRRLKS